MSIKHLQQFNIGGDHRDQIPLVPAFQLCRTELSQRAEHPVAQQRQQFKCDKVVARLLRIPQKSPEKGEDKNGNKNRCQSKRYFKPKGCQHTISAENGDKGGAQMPDEPHQNRQRHVTAQGFYQSDQPCHNGKSASLFHTPAHSFPNCSNVCWALHSRSYRPWWESSSS